MVLVLPTLTRRFHVQDSTSASKNNYNVFIAVDDVVVIIINGVVVHTAVYCSVVLVVVFVLVTDVVTTGKCCLFWCCGPHNFIICSDPDALVSIFVLTRKFK
jgi:hypothetical protein